MSDTDPSLRWSWAKSDYLGGEPVTAILKAYGIPRTTFYRRGKREGWLRPGDHAEAIEARALEPAPPPQILADQAMDEVARALTDGDLQATEGWLRVVKRLRDLAIQNTVWGDWRDTLDRLQRAETVPAERNTVEQASAPETEAPQRIAAPERNSPADPPDAQQPAPEAAATAAQADPEAARTAPGAPSGHSEGQAAPREAREREHKGGGMVENRAPSPLVNPTPSSSDSRSLPSQPRADHGGALSAPNGP